MGLHGRAEEVAHLRFVCAYASAYTLPLCCFGGDEPGFALRLFFISSRQIIRYVHLNQRQVPSLQNVFRILQILLV